MCVNLEFMDNGLCEMRLISHVWRKISGVMELSGIECRMCARSRVEARQFTGRPFSGREMQYVCSRREHKFMIYGDKGT